MRVPCDSLILERITKSREYALCDVIRLLHGALRQSLGCNCRVEHNFLLCISGDEKHKSSIAVNLWSSSFAHSSFRNQRILCPLTSSSTFIIEKQNPLISLRYTTFAWRGPKRRWESLWRFSCVGVYWNRSGWLLCPKACFKNTNHVKLSISQPYELLGARRPIEAGQFTLNHRERCRLV